MPYGLQQETSAQAGEQTGPNRKNDFLHFCRTFNDSVFLLAVDEAVRNLDPRGGSQTAVDIINSISRMNLMAALRKLETVSRLLPEAVSNRLEIRIADIAARHLLGRDAARAAERIRPQNIVRQEYLEEAQRRKLTGITRLIETYQPQRAEMA